MHCSMLPKFRWADGICRASSLVLHPTRHFELESSMRRCNTDHRSSATGELLYWLLTFPLAFAANGGCPPPTEAGLGKSVEILI